MCIIDCILAKYLRKRILCTSDIVQSRCRCSMCADASPIKLTSTEAHTKTVFTLSIFMCCLSLFQYLYSVHFNGIVSANLLILVS